ncbi:MAG: plasmid pRiA4b ORF-3 family protein [Nostoc desertorum CM1-VF14]|nr:plasmid pRiA4b ORF-3 family protein [Nostoc desertorum CM1-VF14]
MRDNNSTTSALSPHPLILAKVLTPDTNYPVCITGKRACPPEDCGGS